MLNDLPPSPAGVDSEMDFVRENSRDTLQPSTLGPRSVTGHRWLTIGHAAPVVSGKLTHYGWLPAQTLYSYDCSFIIDVISILTSSCFPY